MKAIWTVVPRGDVVSQAAGIYVSLTRRGLIAMNRVTFERVGSPTAFLLLFDKVNNRIALKPTIPAIRNAYPVMTRGRRMQSRCVNAYRLLVEFGIEVPETLEFKNAEIDQDGQLILDLRTAKVSRRAHSQCRRSRTQNR
jgi:hypothetical protein